MEPDCDVENLKVQTTSKVSAQNNGCRSSLTPAKRRLKGQSMEPDCDVEKLKIQSMCKGNCFYKRVVNKRSRTNILSKSSFKSHQILIKIEENCAQGVPPERQTKRNLAPTWPKMLPRVVLKMPWRPLGGALGGPRGSQVGAKSKLGGCFSEVEKALV